MRIDLHIHTTASDGCWPAERVADACRARSIGLFAIADHDTVAGVKPAETAAHEAGLAFLRGVEVSSALDGDVFHILAYDCNLEAPALSALLRENAAAMETHSREIIGRLIEAGHAIDSDGYESYTHDHTRGGWKLLNFMIDGGFCDGIHGYFEDLTADMDLGLPSFRHPTEVIAVIHESGGVPILAHPGVSLRRAGSDMDALEPFRAFGIAGLECYSQYHDAASTRSFADWCVRHDLLITGGSDYHGGFVGRQLGVPVVDTADLCLGALAGRIR